MHRLTLAATATLVALSAAARPASPQAPASHAGHPSAHRPDSVAEAAFIDAARAATVRYRDIDVARADGYRRVGGELPSLGEHWVHSGRAIADTLDPAAPPILVYAYIDGRPVLAGVAYTRFLKPGDAYPEFPRSAAHPWHDHNGGVDDEVLPLGHLATSAPAATGTRLRIAVMHAWIGIENPAGLWTSDNWGLPYARLGLSPTGGGADARALSLAADGEDYYLRAIVSTAGLDAAERERVRALLSDHAARVMAVARAAANPGDASVRALRRTDVDALASLWSSMWNAIDGAIRPEAAARLRPLRDALVPRP
jgi:hypothetical protein